MFAKGVAVADDQAGWFTVVFHVLRCVADGAAGGKLIGGKWQLTAALAVFRR